MTPDEIQHAAEMEELRLAGEVALASDRIAELANRYPIGPDQRHDLRIDRENAIAAYEAAQGALSAFWAIASDEAMEEYLRKREAVKTVLG